MESIQNRSEFLFLYDVKDANPNGDPLDENKPRMDEETGQIIVTDVRLKRTIRDYLARQGQNIFILELHNDKGNLITKEERAAQFQDVLKECIDLRLFGATTAIKGKTQTWIGPVQFKFGRSLHKVCGPQLFKGTTVMPSSGDKKQGTFREEWIVPYAMIAFYGIANEYAAKETGMTEDDLNLLVEAMWNGTKDLITRSKFGQMPRLLLRIIYKQNQNFYIGELNKLIQWQANDNLQDEQIRDITDGILKVDNLLQVIEQYKEKIEKIELAVQQRLTTHPDLQTQLTTILGEEKIQNLQFV